MSAINRREHPRYPAWFPIGVTLAEGQPALSGMLCDISVGGALVWAFCDESPGEYAVLDISFGSAEFKLPGKVVSVERQWDTVILHLRFEAEYAEATPRLGALIAEFREHFQSYQAYLANRWDDDPALGRTSTQYPADRKTA
jgi:hypothetical protein